MIAAAALANGLKANMVRKWVIEARKLPVDFGTAHSIPNRLDIRGFVAARTDFRAAGARRALSAPSATSKTIQIQLCRGEATARARERARIGRG